jgi:hypothetical protein
MAHVEGIRKVKDALARRRAFYAAGVERGLVKAGLQLLRASMPLVPVDLGPLVNSGPAVTRAEGKGFDTVMIVGYGQDYAVHVHENLEAAHKEGKQAKFLEQPLNEMRSDLSKTVRQEAILP